MVEIGKKYSGGELKRLLTPEVAKGLQARGMVLEFDVMSQTYQLTHFTKAKTSEISGKPVMGQGAFEPLDPIRKRTPQERVDSLMLRLIEDCKAAGTVPGLDDMRISHILGEAWKTGRSEVTAEVIRQVAQDFLADAEAKKNHADYKRTVTPSLNA